MKQNYPFRVSLLLLLLLATGALLSSIQAQNSPLLFQSQIQDSTTRQALAFVHIQATLSNTGTVSDLNGNFQINVLPGELIKLSYVGYAEKAITVNPSTNPKVVLMVEKKQTLSEFVVTPQENPAWRILRAAMRNRDAHNPDLYKTYQYQAYNKSIIHAESLEGRNQMLNRQRDSIQNLQAYKKIDSSKLKSFFKDQMYLWLKEAQVKVIHEKPDRTKELILSHKSSMPDDFSGAFTPTDFQPLGFYKELIVFDANAQSYINPLSTNSTSRYDFRLENTILKNQDTVFVISFLPKVHRNFNGFQGQFYINSDGYAIENVIARTVDTLGKIRIRIQQQSKKVGEHWFPEMLETDVRLELGNSKQGQIQVSVKNRSYLSDVIINQDIPFGSFTYAKREELTTVNTQPDSSWLAWRIEPLNTREQHTYQFWDSLEVLKPIRRVLKVYNGLIRTIASDQINLNPSWSLRLSEFLKTNVYEGTRWGLGLQFRPEGISWLTIHGSTGYGIRDQAWKYRLDLEARISSRYDLKFRLTALKDLAEPGATAFLIDKHNVVFAANEIRNWGRYRLDQVKTLRGEFLFRPWQGLQLNPFLQQEKRNILAYDYGYNTEAPSHFFDAYSYGLNLRFAPNEVIYKTQSLESILNATFPVLEVHVNKTSLSEQMGSFTKLEMSWLHQLDTKWLGKSIFKLSVGKIWGAAPYPYLFNAPGSNRHKDFQLIASNTFQTADFYEFTQDQYVSFFLEQRFGALLYKSQSKYFKPALSLVQNLGFGRLAHPQQHYKLALKTMEKGYFESGLYVRNLLRLPYFDLFYLNFGVGAMYRWGAYQHPGFKDNLVTQFIFGMGF